MAKKAKIKRTKNLLNIQPKKTSFYWMYFVLGSFVILLGLVFAPFWQYFGLNDEGNFKIPWAKLSTYALGIILAVAILVYVFWILVKKIKQKGLTKNVRILIGVEISCMSLIALFCVFKSIFYERLVTDPDKWSWFNTLVILSIVLWIRGVVEMVNAYKFTPGTEQVYPMWYLLLNIAFVTFGPVLFVVGLQSKGNVDSIVSWIFTCFLIFGGSMFCVWGGLSKPGKVKVEPVGDEPELLLNKTLSIETQVVNEISEFKEEKQENKVEEEVLIERK